MDISIIIPTHNRANSIVQAVGSATVLHYPPERYEIIVVDNCSTDGTPEVVPTLHRRPDQCSLRYLQEPQLGLHHARHAGARAAKGKVLVFTDDDATFDTGWLQAYSDAFEAYPRMAAAAGPVRPIWEVPPPEWLLKFIGDAKVFGCLSLMELYKEFRLDPKGIFFGVNMAIRRQLLFDVGGFNPEAFGDVWLGDGESGLNRKLWERGLLIGYVPDAVVYHHIPAERMTVEYLCRRMANEGACAEYATFHRRGFNPVILCVRITRLVLSFVKLAVRILATTVLRRDGFALLKARMRFAYQFSRLRYVSRLLHDQAFRDLVEEENWLTK
jgi:glucosyl-dolichyl phosphate glucuronosyltransferase